MAVDPRGGAVADLAAISSEQRFLLGPTPSSPPIRDEVVKDRRCRRVRSASRWDRRYRPADGALCPGAAEPSRPTGARAARCSWDSISAARLCLKPGPSTSCFLPGGGDGHAPCRLPAQARPQTPLACSVAPAIQLGFNDLRPWSLIPQPSPRSAGARFREAEKEGYRRRAALGPYATPLGQVD
jgi:hypothetical protein